MKTKKWLKLYDEISTINEGGNAIVYEVIKKTDKTKVALKEQQKLSNEKKERFKSEIKIMCQYKEYNILPIYNSSYDNKNGYWYTMPIAKTLRQYIKDKNFEEKIKSIIEIAETLVILHHNNVTHRDIKPDNIFYYNGHYCLGDFGLVDFPENEAITKTESHLGAWSTMAPEMRRNPKEADGKKADVYSLAKTLWIILKNDYGGFDGEYNFLNPEFKIIPEKISKYSIVEIHELLLKSTKNNPDKRPNMDEFLSSLKKWIKEKNDFVLSQKKEYDFVQKQLFSIPTERACWTDIDSIIHVLNIISITGQLSHMLFPDGGGIDLEKVSKSSKLGYIQINNYILKPKKLLMEIIENDPLWNYFLLEIDNIGSENEEDFFALLPNGEEVLSDGIIYGVYDYQSGKKLPNGYQLVTQINKGKILFVLKTGCYNHITATYDGRHNLCSDEQFRYYIKQLKRGYDIAIEKGYKNSENILNLDYFYKNPFNANTYEKVTKYSKETDPEDFIESEYTNWDFVNCINKLHFIGNKPVIFYIEFMNPKKSHLYEGFFSKEKLCINQNGRIEKIKFECNKKLPDNILLIHDREMAINICKQMQDNVKTICEEKNYYVSQNYFNVIMCRNFNINPSHIFTKDEIKKVIIEADDRHHNNLVIDENGEVKVINSNEENPFLYPVRSSQWDAGNRYVGKYADLPDYYIEGIHNTSVQAWLNYLKTGKNQYLNNYVICDNLDSFLNEICKICDIS